VLAYIAQVGAGQHPVEQPAILEAAVQALAVERHDGVRGIAEQQDAPVDLPALAVHGTEPALRMRRKLLREIGDGLCGVGELRVEEVQYGIVGLELVESGLAVARQEQCGSESAVGIGQRNQHVAAARPDVQCPRLERIAFGSRRIGRNAQFLVVVIQRLLMRMQQPVGVQGRAYRRSGAVGAQQDLEIFAVVATAALIAQPHAAGGRIDVETAGIESQLDARACRRRLDQDAVEPLTADGVDDFVLVLAVAQELQRAAFVVQHAAGHRHHCRGNALRNSGLVEREQAARGHRQIDRAAAFGRRIARVRAALDQPHGLAALGQHQRHQSADRAGTDQCIAGHGCGLQSDSRTASDSCQAARSTSSKLL